MVPVGGNRIGMENRLAEVSAPFDPSAEARPALDIVAWLRREHASAIAGGIGWGAWTEEEAPTTETIYSVAANEIERLRRAPTAEGEGWRPIESAPKDGKWVLLWWEYVTDTPFAGYCFNGTWRAAPSGDTWPEGPTHWMPLPQPPATETVAPQSEAKQTP